MIKKNTKKKINITIKPTDRPLLASDSDCEQKRELGPEVGNWNSNWNWRKSPLRMHALSHPPATPFER